MSFITHCFDVLMSYWLPVFCIVHLNSEMQIQLKVWNMLRLEGQA